MSAEEAPRGQTDKIRIGGLMPCCTETIEKLYYPYGELLSATEGQKLQCKYTDSPNHRMIFRDGAWEWDHPGDNNSPAMSM